MMSEREFLGLYMTSGLLSGAASLVFNVALRNAQHGLGASGALFGVLGYWCLAFREEGHRVLLFFVLPVTPEQVRAEQGSALSGGGGGAESPCGTRRCRIL
jgi:membrane associated rhomboid family serine protease